LSEKDEVSICEIWKSWNAS